MDQDLDTGNENFELATKFVKYTSEHIFLTGKAGTGKTTFLRYIKSVCKKKLVLTAPTGVAAINAGGVTLHSFFQLPLGTYIANHQKSWQNEDDRFIVNRQQLLGNLRIRGNKRQAIKELELLIIDEISMVRADTLDAVDTILRSIRRRQDLPFGGVQVLLIGDLYQLPPVVRRDEMMLMAENYQSPFFFDAMVMKETSLLCIELKRIYRQDDDTFINLLNNIRNNAMEQEDLELLHSRYDPHFMPNSSDNIITLTSHNEQAAQINAVELQKLPNAEMIMSAEVEKDFPNTAFPMEELLVLKEGAQIMFIKNDKGEDRRYYNGKIGKIYRIDKSANTIEIEFPGEANIKIEPETWENVKFRHNEEKDAIESEVVGTFQQFPIRLAWAVTIHKSQGLTFEHAVIDAGRSFAPGQVYVALSRLTSLKGMVLRSRITPEAVLIDPRVLEYMSSASNPDQLFPRLEVAQGYYIAQLLTQCYDWNGTYSAIQEYVEQGLTSTARMRLLENSIYSQSLQALQHLGQIGYKFMGTIQQLMDLHDYPQLDQRLSDGASWYAKQSTELLLLPLSAWQQEAKLQKNGSATAQAIATILARIGRRLYDLTTSSVISSILAHGGSTTEALAAWEARSPYSSKYLGLEAPKSAAVAKAAAKSEQKDANKEKKTPTKELSLNLFREKNSVAEIAKIREMVESTIYGHLSTYILTGEVKAEELVSSENLIKILDVVKSNPAATTTEIKALLPADLAYDEIRVAQAHIEYLAKK